MIHLWRENYTRHEILRRVGDISQLAGVHPFELADGTERGTRCVRMYNAAGLELTIPLERGMSITHLTYRGVPLPYISPVGTAHPAYAEQGGKGWLRTWPGGFLTPCGLTQVGSPHEDEGEQLGLHGRVASLPAYQTSWGGDWQDEDYIIWVEGTVREAVVFGENISLKRRIWTRINEPRLWIEDQVQNHGFSPAPHMFLQHINLGFPLLCEDSRLELPERHTRPRDEAARPGLEECCVFDAPIAGYQEQVFYHALKADANGQVEVRLINPAFNGGQGLGLYLRYALVDYPNLVEWKMLGEGLYVLGLEPANCHVEGRRKEREMGTLQMLAPQEVRTYGLEIGFIA